MVNVQKDLYSIWQLLNVLKEALYVHKLFFIILKKMSALVLIINLLTMALNVSLAIYHIIGISMKNNAISVPKKLTIINKRVLV